jgi:hypothetical protein
MRINAKMLKNVANVNQWEWANNTNIQEGQVNEIYFQIVDLDKPLSANCHMRYLSVASSVAVEATFPALDDSEVLVKIATQPFSQDNSIWKITFAASELPKSGSFQVKLTEDGVDKYFIVQAAIQVNLLNSGGC